MGTQTPRPRRFARRRHRTRSPGRLGRRSVLVARRASVASLSLAAPLSLALVASLATLALVASLAPSLAQATPTPPPCVLPLSAPPAVSGCVAGEGAGAGQVGDPRGVAVNQSTGDTYVVDSERAPGTGERVEEFNKEGAFVRAWGWGVSDGKAAFEVCTSSCAGGLSGSGGGQLGHPVGVAVDNSGHASAGDVYVTEESDARVQEFSAEGTFDLMFGKEVNKTAVKDHGSEAEQNICTAASHDECGAGVQGSGPGEFATKHNPVTVDASGHVWLGDDERLEEFSSAGALLDEVALSALPGSGAVVGLAVEGSPPLAGDFYLRSSELAGVRKLEGGGTPVAGFPPLDEAGHPNALALNPETGDVFVSDQVEHSPGTATLLEFSSSGVELASFAHGQVIGEPGGEPGDEVDNALALDDAGKALYVASSDGQNGQAAVQAFAVPVPGPFVGSLSVLPVRTTTATLHATVNPENVEARYRFEYLTEAVYQANVEAGNPAFSGAKSTAEDSLVGEFAEDEVSAAIEGLTPATGYRFCLAAHNTVPQEGNATCSGADVASFTTSPAAEVSEEAAAKVTSESATLQASINPLGASTEYHFEYLPEATYLENVSNAVEPFKGAVPLPVPDGLVGASEEAHEVTVNVQGLSADTAYRYRVVAHNDCNSLDQAEVCTSAGEPRTFTTQATFATSSGTSLPDDRAWEMVSPPDKHGALIEPIRENLVVQAASSGEAFTYAANGGAEEGTPGNDRLSQFLSRRTPSGWVTQNISVAHGGATREAAGQGQDYRYFSETLEAAIVEPHGPFSPFVSAQASEQTPYVRSDLTNSTSEPCTSSCYAPLVTGKEGVANVPTDPFIPFGHQGNVHPGEEKTEGPEFLGATADAKHAVLFSQVPLTGTPIPTGEGEGALYEWSGGALTLVSMLPQTKEQKEKGEEPLASEPELGLGHEPKVGAPLISVSKRGAISADGSRVVFSEHLTEAEAAGLFLRDVPQGRTIELDAPEAGCISCESGRGQFQLAIEAGAGHGERVLFTDERRLTSDSGSATNSSDLYQCEIVEGSEGVECLLSDLTPKTQDGESAGVQGLVIGASTDGSYLYFVAHGVLTSAPAPDGQVAQPGGENLYVSREGTVSLVAVLSGKDRPDWAIGVLDQTTLTALTAEVSGDGQYLVFMSSQSLTGYDNVDVSPQAHGALDEEVYVFHAAEGGEGGTGSLTCTSCDPSGARPAGQVTGERSLVMPGSGEIWPVGSWIAGDVPGWTPYAAAEALFESRFLSDSGRTFFDSSDALVPADVNGVGDVYEYEPVGVGDCTTETKTASWLYRPARHFEVEGRSGVEPGGCVGLISSGAAGAGESGFLDASAGGGEGESGKPGSTGGEDVFFITANKLVPQDFDTSLDVYDAHVCSAESPCSPQGASESPECVTAEACRAAPQPEPNIYGPPSSATFNGQGNVIPPPPAKPAVKKPLTRSQKLKAALAACQRDHKKAKRVKCERTARKRYGVAKKSEKK